MRLREVLTGWRCAIQPVAGQYEFQSVAWMWGAVSVLAGCLAAILIGLWLPVSTAGLEEAKRLGIVSGTVLNDYPKTHDSAVYMVSLAAGIPIALLVWHAGVFRFLRSRPITPTPIPSSTPTASFFPSALRALFWFDYVFIPLLFMTLSYDGRFFTDANGSAVLLFEEGEFADWVHKILHGGVLHRDAFCLYGPLMVYPIVWSMQLFGTSLLVMRIYCFVVNIVAYFLFYIILRDITRRRTVALAGALLFFSFYYPFFTAPNGSMLRISIGLMPPLLCYHWIRSQKIFLIISAGILAGLLVFYSQEVGIGAIISVTAMLILHSIEQSPRDMVKTLGPFFLGVAAGAAPVMIAFAAMDALGDMIVNLIEYPRYAMLGYAARPYPSLISAVEKLLANPSYIAFRSLSAVLMISYWPVVLYASVVIYALIRYGMGRLSSLDLVLFGIACFGLVYFRSALGRSGFDKNGTVFPPGLMLSAILLYRFWDLGRTAITSPVWGRRIAGFYTFTGGIVVAGLTSYGLWVSNFSLKLTWDCNLHKVIDSASYWREIDWSPSRVPVLSGMYTPVGWEDHLMQVAAYIQTHTRPDDPIYVFPNEPIYYFLLDRKNPTRFSYSQHAITTQDRIETVRALKKTRPLYVLYFTTIWRLDDIPEEIAVPEITEYIRKSYRLEQAMGPVQILKYVGD